MTDRFYDMGWPDLPPSAGASALLSTRDDTAQSPDDYAPTSGVLTWGDSETGCKAIPITVRVDGWLEATESKWVELTDPVAAGPALLMLLAALACCRRFVRLAVARRRRLELRQYAGTSMLEGRWRVTTTPYDCVTGKVFPLRTSTVTPSATPRPRSSMSLARR